MSASADGAHIWGIADAGTGTQLIYVYDRDTGRATGQVWITTPSLLPRLSVAGDGSWALIGWSLYARAQCGGGFMVRARYPNAIASTNITGHAVDTKNGLIYAQIADGTQPAGPPFAAGKLPTLAILDSDNLTVARKSLFRRI